MNLADAALAGRRERPDLSTLAAAADAPVSSTHLALGRLVDIGTVQTRRRGGLVVVSPDRVVLTLAVNCNLIRNTVAMTTVVAAQSLTKRASIGRRVRRSGCRGALARRRQHDR